MTAYDYIIAGAGSAGLVYWPIDCRPIRVSRCCWWRRVAVTATRCSTSRRAPGCCSRTTSTCGTTPPPRSGRIRTPRCGCAAGSSVAPVRSTAWSTTGARADYDELEHLGNKGWGWDEILPIFKGFEDNEFGSSPTRGVGGPLHISVPRDPDPLCEKMMAAGTRVGLTKVQDINESDTERIGYATSTIKNGRRVSAATAFLKPVLRRPNLTVLTNTTVRRILLENGRAVGLEVAGKRGAGRDPRLPRGHRLTRQPQQSEAAPAVRDRPARGATGGRRADPGGTSQRRPQDA